jgi:hypothetical protein
LRRTVVCATKLFIVGGLHHEGRKVLLLFFCSNDTLPLSRQSAADVIDGRTQPVCDERFARCLAPYQGVFGVLATASSPGIEFGEARVEFGPEGSRIVMFVNSFPAKSPYQFVKDFMGARNVGWIALAESRLSFPAELQHRVVEFDFKRDGLETACAELDRLLAESGADATTVCTPDEMFDVFVDRVESALYVARRAIRERRATQELETRPRHGRRRQLFI